MTKIKQKLLKKDFIEYLMFGLVLIFIIIHGIIRQEYFVAIISALCGITYTAIAGKGHPICYLFGITGSFFYSYLSFKNALWGNLILYAGYYIPMQILGFFQWNKNLKKNYSIIVKTRLSNKLRLKYLFFTILFSLICIFIMKYFSDSRPILDGITTVFSIAGMYFTVKRCIEQWIAWMIVNTFSFLMWLIIALQGERVFSTVIMWGVYLVLAIYFYYQWKGDIAKS